LHLEERTEDEEREAQKVATVQNPRQDG
jgi:hypothetical protein